MYHRIWQQKEQCQSRSSCF